MNVGLDITTNMVMVAVVFFCDVELVTEIGSGLITMII